MPELNVLTDLLVIFVVSIIAVFGLHKFLLPPIAGFLVAGARSS